MPHKCPNCDEEIKDKNSQNFCENCGFDLTQTEKTKAQTPLKISENNKIDLFDTNQNYYILKENYWKTGSGFIYNPYDQIIGIVDTIRKNKIELKENNGTVSATVNFKGSMKGASELKDKDGKMLAKLKKKKISTFNSIYFLEDPKGTRWYEATGEFISFQFQIKDLSINRIVAECDLTEKWKDSLHGNFDHKNTHALTILDNETDRRILLLFLIGIRQIRYFRQF